jgi:hypothetical protein
MGEETYNSEVNKQKRMKRNTQIIIIISYMAPALLLL